MLAGTFNYPKSYVARVWLGTRPTPLASYVIQGRVCDTPYNNMKACLHQEIVRVLGLGLRGAKRRRCRLRIRGQIAPAVLSRHSSLRYNTASSRVRFADEAPSAPYCALRALYSLACAQRMVPCCSEEGPLHTFFEKIVKRRL